MKISFLVPDVANPVIGPVTVLARHLESRYEVEIVGPDLGHGVCPMYRGSYPYKAVPTPRLYRLPEYFREARKLGDALEGDVIFSVKASAATLPVALREKRRRGKKVVVYLDEWDGAVFRQLPAAVRRRMRLTAWHHPLDDLYTSRVERMIKRADEVTSTTTFLRKKFGGQVLHMGVDMDLFQPPPVKETESLKESLGLQGVKLVGFGGVVRPHKGLEGVLDALVAMDGPPAKLLVIGPESDHLRHLQSVEAYRDLLYCTGAVPKAEMPRYLALADMVALPQVDTVFAQSQMPCKIFEAMAMAKPIVATAVADLPDVLDGCGWIVPPEDGEALSRVVREILDHPEEAGRRGAAAREKCEQTYSAARTREQLVNLVENL